MSGLGFGGGTFLDFAFNFVTGASVEGQPRFRGITGHLPDDLEIDEGTMATPLFPSSSFCAAAGSAFLRGRPLLLDVVVARFLPLDCCSGSSSFLATFACDPDVTVTTSAFSLGGLPRRLGVAGDSPGTVSVHSQHGMSIYVTSFLFPLPHFIRSFHFRCWVGPL